MQVNQSKCSSKKSQVQVQTSKQKLIGSKPKTIHKRLPVPCLVLSSERLVVLGCVAWRVSMTWEGGREGGRGLFSFPCFFFLLSSNFLIAFPAYFFAVRLLLLLLLLLFGVWCCIKSSWHVMLGGVFDVLYYITIGRR